MTSLMEWWLCAQWEALHMSASQRIQEVLWSVLSVIAFRAAYEGFHFYCLGAGGGIIAPHCTGGSRGWRLAAAEGPIDYWPGVKFYPACFSLPVPDPLLPREMGCHCFPTRGREGKGREGKGWGGEAAIWCFIVPSLLFWLISSTNVKPPVHDLFAVWGMWLSGIS